MSPAKRQQGWKRISRKIASIIKRNKPGKESPSQHDTSNVRSTRISNQGEVLLVNKGQSEQRLPYHVIPGQRDSDIRGEDVADRNLARLHQFPPRVSSAAYVDKPQQQTQTEQWLPKEVPVSVTQGASGIVREAALMSTPAAKLPISRGKHIALIPGDEHSLAVANSVIAKYSSFATTQTKFRPLLPDDTYSTDVADWNIVQCRSPLSAHPAAVPSPLLVKKRTAPATVSGGHWM